MKYVFLVHAALIALMPVLTKKHRKLYYFITALALSSLAYFVVPYPEMDLYRYIDIMKYSRQMGFEWAMNNYGSSNPLAAVFLYGMSLFNNDRILPAAAVFIVYGLSLTILYKASKKIQVSNCVANIAFVFLILNLNYCYVIDVVRIYIAYAVFAYFLYMDLIEKKHRLICFAVYIAICYFHYALLIFVLLRIIFLLTSKFTGVLSFVSTVAIPAVLLAGYTVIDKFTGKMSLLEFTSDKIDAYKTYEVFGIWQFLASMAKVAVFIIICMMTSFVYSEMKKRAKIGNTVVKSKTDLYINQYAIFCIYITLSVISFITNYQYVLRTPYFIQILVSVPVLFVLSNLQKLDRKFFYAFGAFALFESAVHFAYLLLYVFRVLEFSFAV